MRKQETFSTSGTRSKPCIASIESTANKWLLTDAPSLPLGMSKCFSVQRNGTHLLWCEGCCWIGLKPRFTRGLCLGTLGMHEHVAAFPYLDVTKISIEHTCLNFAVYST